MSLLRPFILSSVAFAACQAIAQTAPTSTSTSGADRATDSGTELGSVVVTARRVGERLQDVPLSIQVLSGKDLQERSITSISELSSYTPGLSYSPDLGRTGERPVVRGISALRPEAPQPVSIFVDGVFVRDGTLGLALDDAQRVEVIKGPQSALYGRSTYAGAINYISVKPSDKVSGTISATAASAGEASAFGAVSFPVLKDVLSARVKVKHYEYGGQYTNVLTGNKIDGERTNAGGVQLFFTPSNNFDALFSLDSSSERDGLFAATARTVPTQAGGAVTNQNGSSNIANGATCNGKTINIVGNNATSGLPDATVPASASTRLNGWPCGPSTFSGTTVKRNEADLANYIDPVTGINYGNVAGLDRSITRGALTLNYNFGAGYTLTSQTAYTRQASNVGADQSYDGTRFAPGFGAPASSWLSYDRNTLNYYSQEFRLTSPQEQALTWLVGGFLYKEEASGEGTGVLAQNAALKTVADTIRPRSASTTRNVAPFGRIQYEFDKKYRVSLEGRYNEETVTVGGVALGTAKVSAGTCVANQVCYVNGSQTFSDFSPRLTFDYKPSADLLYYAQAAKGSKAGGFNTAAGLPAQAFAYDGESIRTVEVGVKTVFAQRKAGFNAALFSNNIDGLQLSNISTVTNPLTGVLTTTTIVNNVGKARSQGLELELFYRPTNWLTLNGNYAYTDAKGVEGTEITNGTAFGGNSSVAGFTLPRSPEHSATGSAALDFPVGANNLRFFARADLVYQSRRYAEIQNLIWADAFTHVNATIGLRGKGWRSALWVKNASNDPTSLNGFRYLDPATFRRTAVDFLPRLRQVGITTSYDF
ncbi:MAG: TonB-dependent receptor [Rhodoferax sp.]|nr:TonB-dependent receptor [Rhodoferax sp.]